MKSGASAPPRGRPLATRPEHDDRYADVGRLLITCPDRPPPGRGGGRPPGRHRAGAPGRYLGPGEVPWRYP
jgi:hypothetical protein